ncbi:ER membrane protein complex subunit 6 [Benincasa hispida]|uniref:ER membrane protein complex subunit 6 n=1 Tax=Benincasa hispida TaxID=102211 RepID=UPI001901204F|nr:ER membrane protein complex subunit 6 [Benincasa hispida]
MNFVKDQLKVIAEWPKEKRATEIELCAKVVSQLQDIPELHNRKRVELIQIIFCSVQDTKSFSSIPIALKLDYCNLLLQENIQINTAAEVYAGYSSTTSEKKSSDAADDLPIFNAENLQNNLKIIYYSRTFLSIIGGVIAGILGFTGLNGFIFYFIVMAITSLALATKAGFSFRSYFESWNQILLDGFLSGLMSFVLFWTFAYDIIHIF